MRFVPQLPGQFTSKDNPNSAKAQFMKNLKKGDKSGKANTDMGERYQEILDQKLEEAKKNAMKGASYTFNLPGTDPSQTRELSQGAQEILQKIAEKQAKREEKKKKKRDIITVKPKMFTGMQGGRIDKNGRIYDSAGQVILEVCKKTGKIKNKMGNVVGKYQADSSYCEHRMNELIAKHSTTNNRGWYAGGAGGGIHDASGGGIWGKSDSSLGNGSIWGDAGGFYGNNSNNSSDNQSWW